MMSHIIQVILNLLDVAFNQAHISEHVEQSSELAKPPSQACNIFSTLRRNHGRKHS
jgi:hypothetical protein